MKIVHITAYKPNGHECRISLHGTSEVLREKDATYPRRWYFVPHVGSTYVLSCGEGAVLNELDIRGYEYVILGESE